MMCLAMPDVLNASFSTSQHQHQQSASYLKFQYTFICEIIITYHVHVRNPGNKISISFNMVKWLQFLLIAVLIRQMQIPEATSTTIATGGLPKILISEDDDGPVGPVTLSADGRRHHALALAKGVRSVSLKCHANYPVKWGAIDSVVQPGVIGADAERLVDLTRLDQPETYEHSMTLHWRLPSVDVSATAASLIDDDDDDDDDYNEDLSLPHVFVCLSASEDDDRDGNGNVDGLRGHRTDYLDLDGLRVRLGIALTIKWDEILHVFVCSLSPVSDDKLDQSLSSSSGLTLTSTRADDDNGAERTSMKASCCLQLQPGPHDHNLVYPVDFAAAVAWNIYIGHGYCSEPLLCIAKNSTLTLNNAQRSHSTELCRSTQVDVDASESESAHAPQVIACKPTNHLDHDRTKGDWGPFSVLVNRESESAAWLEYQSQSQLDNSNGNQWTRGSVSETEPFIFYTGDVVLFRCQASTIVYAKGIVWELEFKNGTRQFVASAASTPHIHGTMSSVELLISMESDSDRESGFLQLVQVSCYIPPWNSKSWVKRVLDVKIRSSSPPILASGTLTEKRTFYSHETVRLDCDFDGQPPPKLEWKLDSCVYALSHTHSGSESSVTISVHAEENPETIRLPEEIFSCSATNLAGNATKFFHVQAIQSYAPVLANGGRETVVFYVGDQNQNHNPNATVVLNCSLAQGVPIPQFYWRRHEKNISSEDDARAAFRIQTSDLWSTLTFVDARVRIRPQDEGEYFCTASNAIGTVTKEFSVRIRERTTKLGTGTWTAPTISPLVVLFASLIGISVLILLWIRNQNKKMTALRTIVEFATTVLSPYEPTVAFLH